MLNFMFVTRVKERVQFKVPKILRDLGVSPELKTKQASTKSEATVKAAQDSKVIQLQSVLSFEANREMCFCISTRQLR
jgi:hypothetical protein